MIPFLIANGPLLLSGLLMTIKLWIGAVTISLAIGTLFGIANCTKLQKKPFSSVINLYVLLARGIPVYIQILMVYFVLPDVLGINLSPYAAAIISLGLCSAGYIAEIVRCGINAIPKGQWDACFVLGYSPYKILRYVILPQMIINVLPALGNEIESTMKSTAILSTIGVLELTRIGGNIVAREMNPVITYVVIACLYLAVSTILAQLIHIFERRVSYDRR